MANYRYKIVKKIDHHLSEPFAEFSLAEDARLFMSAKIEADKQTGACITYYLFDEEELLDEMEGEVALPDPSTTKKHHTVFNPTPLSTTPVPPGVLSTFLIEEEDEDKEKDK